MTKSFALVEVVAQGLVSSQPASSPVGTKLALSLPMVSGCCWILLPCQDVKGVQKADGPKKGVVATRQCCLCLTCSQSQRRLWAQSEFLEEVTWLHYDCHSPLQRAAHSLGMGPNQQPAVENQLSRKSILLSKEFTHNPHENVITFDSKATNSAWTCPLLIFKQLRFWFDSK